MNICVDVIGWVIQNAAILKSKKTLDILHFDHTRLELANLAYCKVQRVFSVRPAMQVAMASMNVAKPMLACTGIIALRHPYVAFSQHKHTKNLQREKTKKTFNFGIDFDVVSRWSVCTYVKNPNTNCSAKSPIVTKPIHE